MSRTFTVSQIKEQIRERCDMQRSRFIGDGELLNYINQSHAALWDLFVNKFEGFGINSVSFSTSTTYDTYQLPPALLRIEKVELNHNGNWRTVKSVPYARINEVGTQSSGTGLPFYYARKGLYQMVLKPAPAAVHSCRISYVERAPTLSEDDQLIDGINGWEQYIIVDCAIKCSDKEERDVSVLMAEKNDLIRRINESMGNRDESDSHGIRDINERAMFNGPESFW